MYKLIDMAVHLLLAGALLLCPVAATAVEYLSLEQAVVEALEANPGLAAIQARAKALSEVPDQAGALPDPDLLINVVNLPLENFSFTQEGMTQFQVGISQRLPYPGKLALQVEAAKYEAAAADSEADERRLQLIRDVKTVWWNLFYLDRALETVKKTQELMAEFVSIAETKYQVGQGLQQDVLLAQVELSKLRDTAIRLKGTRENEAARLNTLLDHRASRSVRLPDTVNQKLPSPLLESELLELANRKRPSLSFERQRMEAARTRVDLANKDYVPEFKIGAVYGLRNGSNPDGSGRSDFGSLLFSMSLPVYSGNKQDRALDQRNAEWLQQKYQLHDRLNQVEAEVREALTDYRRAGEQADLFQQEIIPQARQTVDVMLAGYQVDKVDFLNLVRSQTTLYDYETEYWKVISAANQALARLVAAVGEENIYE